MGAYTLEVQSKNALIFTAKHQRFSSVISSVKRWSIQLRPLLVPLGYRGGMLLSCALTFPQYLLHCTLYTAG